MSGRVISHVVAGIVGVACLACAAGPEETGPLVAPATPPAPEPPAPQGPPECGDPCLLLLVHDSRELEDGGYCELCGEVDPAACTDGFALRDLTCDRMDWVRNCMYARLGYTFSGDEAWREVFDAEGWYAPREDFRWSDVDRTQVRNAKRLKSLEESGRCAR